MLLSKQTIPSLIFFSEEQKYCNFHLANLYFYLLHLSPVPHFFLHVFLMNRISYLCRMLCSKLIWFWFLSGCDYLVRYIVNSLSIYLNVHLYFKVSALDNPLKYCEST